MGIITDGKQNKPNRYIALGEQALKEIETHLQRRKKNNLKVIIFCDEYGKQIPARKIGNEWRKWRVENNINCTNYMELSILIYHLPSKKLLKRLKI